MIDCKTYRQALLPKGPTEYLIVEESLVNFYEKFFCLNIALFWNLDLKSI